MSPETSEYPTQLGNYDVLAKIAEGGMGTVYKCRSRATGDFVAIKVISPGTTRNPIVLQRFEREFMAARVLDHPNVVRAIEYCGTGPNPFLVMEFVDGESLGQRIERIGSLPEAEAVGLIAQVCDGLQRAHKQGLVHRDVKPDNILVTLSGVAKLTDMGLVKDIDGDLNLTKTGRGLGTPHFMAPEQFRNAKGVDVRGDIYSLGATLYALVTGTIPFQNSNPLDCWMKKIRNEFATPKELNSSVSDRLDWAIRRAMSAEPAQRPASCREFLEDLTGLSRSPSPGKLALATRTAVADVWYMVYRDESGQVHTVKGATANIRNALRDGLLGDASAILVGRTKTGQFQPIGSVPEFRDLVVAPAPLSSPGRAATSGSASGRLGRRPSEEESVGADGSSSTGSGGSGRWSAHQKSNSGRGSQPSTPRSDAPLSGRFNATGAPRSSPVIEELSSHSSSDETVTYEKHNPSITPPLTHRSASAKTKPSVGKSFDWTPVMMVFIAFLSALIGFLLFMK